MSESDEPQNPEPRDPWAPPAEPAPAPAAPEAAAAAAPPAPEPVDAPPPVEPTKPSAPTGFAAPGADAPAPGVAPPPPPPMAMPYPPYPTPPPGFEGYPAYQPYPAYSMAPYGAWPPPAARNAFGTTAMVLGIVAAVLAMSCVGAFLGLPPAIGAIIFGIIGLRIAKRGEATNRSQALTGLILGIVAAVISAAMIALFLGGAVAGAFDDWETDGGSAVGADSGDYYRDPLSEDDNATYDDGVLATVSAVQSTSALKDVTGGSALTFTVTLVNQSDAPVDLSQSEIRAYAEPDDVENGDALQDLSTDDGLSGALAPDETMSTTVIVLVPDDDDGTIELEVAPGYDYDYVYWEVAA